MFAGGPQPAAATGKRASITQDAVSGRFIPFGVSRRSNHTVFSTRSQVHEPHLLVATPTVRQSNDYTRNIAKCQVRSTKNIRFRKVPIAAGRTCETDFTANTLRQGCSHLLIGPHPCRTTSLIQTTWLSVIRRAAAQRQTAGRTLAVGQEPQESNIRLLTSAIVQEPVGHCKQFP